MSILLSSLVARSYEKNFIEHLPPKLQKVEGQLQKFRDEKLLHEIKAVKLKQLEEEKERYRLFIFILTK